MTPPTHHDVPPSNDPPVDFVEADLRRARGLVGQAAHAVAPRDQYLAALVAAEFAATAVLRAQPRRRSATRDVWRLTAAVTPEFAEWAEFFSVCRSKLLPDGRVVATAREVDDLVRDAGLFVDTVADWMSRRHRNAVQDTA